MTKEAAAQEPAPPVIATGERMVLAEDVDLLVRLADRGGRGDSRAVARARSGGLVRSRPDGRGVRRRAQADRGRAGRAVGAGDDGAARRLAAEFAAIHLTNGYDASPSESVWRDEDHLERQEAMFRAREWYARHGVKAPNWRVRADDHLVNELQFLALLLRGGGSRDDLGEAARFLRDHLLVWTPLFADRVAARCRLQLYAGLSLALAIYLRRLGAALSSATGVDPTPPELVFKQSKDEGPTCGSPRGELKAPQNTPFTGPAGESAGGDATPRRGSPTSPRRESQHSRVAACGLAFLPSAGDHTV
ncbi:MAG: molecular chaperone TorD family protein [Rhodoblastus sp.]|nr:MAG: molecular chaperone TorD family protein [Rhodoblastus sp.]